MSDRIDARAVPLITVTIALFGALLSVLQYRHASYERAELDGPGGGQAAVTSEIDKASGRASELRSRLLSAAFTGRPKGRSSDLDLAEDMAFA